MRRASYANIAATLACGRSQARRASECACLSISSKPIEQRPATADPVAGLTLLGADETTPWTCGLEQFRNSRRLLRASKGGVFLMKTPLGRVPSVYTNSETAVVRGLGQCVGMGV